MSQRMLFINPPVLAVDAFQVGLYAEAIPFGLIQIATYMREAGNQVEFLDMMGYADGDFAACLREENLWGSKPVGDIRVGALRPVYRYGRSLQWLRERLSGMPAPGEIFVTCCISFNYEPAHEVIRICREVFPDAEVHLGGFYPSMFPDQARASGAQDVHVGRHLPAEECFPGLDLLDGVPPIWLFRLVLGCKYRCSFCVNSFYRTEVVNDPAEVTAEILKINKEYGVSTYSNWDPNVMLRTDVLEQFLDCMIAEGSPVETKFEMGIQPDLLTPEMIAKMRRANVAYMTIPFESAEDRMMKRFGKTYKMGASMDAVAHCREAGFDTSRFHCTWVVGIRGESYRHLFRTYLGILKAGGFPTPFPLSFTPGTREYQLHEQHLAGKDLSELNGHLWPALESMEKVQEYDLIFEMINQPDPRRAASLAKDLPADAARAFEREYSWFLEGPHRPGAKT
jgi:radical SAM superfamily enzyme YgiQ (UPF0313 family)